MLLKRIRRRAMDILRRWKIIPPVRGCYVDRYLRPGYGTRAQLCAGLLDHRTTERVPEAILDRLINAWRAMKSAAGFSAAYDVTGEWRPIVTTAMAPLGDAFDQEDRESLDRLLPNFFRKFGDFFGEPTNIRPEAHKQRRCEHFRVYASRWLDLYGEASLIDACVPLVGNPIGFALDGSLYTADSFRHNFYARRMMDLAAGIEAPVLCEIGGGFGGFARHLISRTGGAFRYIDYDIPLIAMVSAYYLMSTCPNKVIRLFGEVDSLAEPVRDCDVAILPHFVLPRLKEASVDICFNTCSFAEMEEATVREYMNQFERVCRKFILLEDHCWTSGSRNAYYEPMGGFRHWDVSRVLPSPDRFQRLHTIPSPFHGDLYGEFFEWLYMKRACP